MSSMRQLMKQAQEMQERLQRELGETTVESSVGGGMVTLVMNGHKQLVSAKIDPEVLDPEDPSVLEDLIVAAVHGAQSRAAEMMKAEMQKMTGDLGLPPGLLG